jgi:hypothetical protein
MRTAWKLMACAATLLLCCSIEAADNAKLLSTAPLAKQVSALGMLLNESPPGGTVEARRKAGFVVRDKFIVDQIEAKPDITKEQLRAQLQAILCASPNTECDCNHPPFIFTNTWFGPNRTSQFVVAYLRYMGFIGNGGVVTVIESYVVEDGKKVRRVAAGGGEFDAYVPNFEIFINSLIQRKSGC